MYWETSKTFTSMKKEKLNWNFTLVSVYIEISYLTYNSNYRRPCKVNLIILTRMKSYSYISFKFKTIIDFTLKSTKKSSKIFHSKKSKKMKILKNFFRFFRIFWGPMISLRLSGNRNFNLNSLNTIKIRYWWHTRTYTLVDLSMMTLWKKFSMTCLSGYRSSTYWSTRTPVKNFYIWYHWYRIYPIRHPLMKYTVYSII